MSDTKDKIMEMPEGKSSEEIDAIMMEGEEGEEEFKADQNLAEEALEATKEESPAEKSVEDEEVEDETVDEEKEEVEETSETETKDVDPKDAVIGEFRRKARDLELENAKLQGELTARRELQTKPAEEPPPKSPLEIDEAKYIEEYGELPEGGLPMTGDLYRRQMAFDAEQADKAKTAKIDTEKKVFSEVDKAFQTLQDGEFSTEKLSEGLDIKSVMAKGQHLLTEGDLLNISSVSKSHGKEEALKEAYYTVIRRLNISSDNVSPTAKKGKAVTQKKPLKTEKDVDDLITGGVDQEGETESEEINPKLKAFAGLYEHIAT